MGKSTNYFIFKDLEKQLKELDKKKKRKFDFWDFFSTDNLYSFDYEKYEKQKDVIIQYYDNEDMDINRLTLRKYYLNKKITSKYSINLPIFLSIIATVVYELFGNRITPVFTEIKNYIDLVVKNSEQILSSTSLLINVIFTLTSVLIILMLAFPIMYIAARMAMGVMPILFDGMKINNYFLREFEIEYIDILIDRKKLLEEVELNEYSKQIEKHIEELENKLNRMKEGIKQDKKNLDTVLSEKQKHESEDNEKIKRYYLKGKRKLDELKVIESKLQDIESDDLE